MRACFGGRPRFLSGVVYGSVMGTCWRFATRLGGRVNFILRDGGGAAGGVG